MLKHRKIVIITLSSLLILSVFTFFGFRSFVSSIQSQRNCEWANIDNIEMHAHIDIPKLIKWDCDYEEALNIKRASFTINQHNFDMDHYIESNELTKFTSDAMPGQGIFLNLEQDSLNNADLYIRNSLFNGEKADILLDKSTGKLWVTIQFKN